MNEDDVSMIGSGYHVDRNEWKSSMEVLDEGHEFRPLGFPRHGWSGETACEFR